MCLIRLVGRARVVALGLAALTSVSVASAAAASIVAIDVGHSQTSPGSLSATGFGEYFYNRALAIDVAKYLRARDIKVEMINEDGTVRSLGARPAQAAAANADLFVSIHHDSIQPSQMNHRTDFRGYSVWTSTKGAKPDESFRCGRTVAIAMRQSGMLPATFHSLKIKGEGRTLLDPYVGHYRRDELAVLRLAQTPAILVEAGVIVNPIEEAWLNTPAYRDALARTIAIGIASCIG